MSAILEELIEKIDDLSADEAFILMKKLADKVSPRPENETVNQQPETADVKPTTESEREAIFAKYFLPRPKTPEERQQWIEKMLTPQQIARLGKTDFKKLTPGKKSLSQMIIEDREDRL
jgi:hypothetical protein